MVTFSPGSAWRSAWLSQRRAATLAFLLAPLAGCAIGAADGRSDASAALVPDAAGTSVGLQTVSARALAARLEVGDLVFIRVGAKPFREVARVTGSWTNHVGIVVDIRGEEPIVAESAFPLSKATPFSRFVGRSEAGRTAVMRLGFALTDDQRAAITAAAERRYGILYDTGFDLHSRREFCSRYVREVLHEATGTDVGKVETFRELLASQPNADPTFWRIWYFGHIPWDRETVTPASVLHSGNLVGVFDGAVVP